MYKKLFVGIFLLLLLFSPLTPVAAEVAIISPNSADIIISEIYPNAPGSSERGSEFIRITNKGTANLLLAGYSLKIGELEPVLLPDNVGLQPGASLIIFPLFASLINSGATVTLNYPDTIILPQSVTYPSGIAETQSWQLIDSVFSKATLIADNSATLDLELKVEEPEETPPAEPPLPEEPSAKPECTATTIYINEILANPAGVDSAGGEFVELYNSGAAEVSLAGCLLSTDKISNYELPDVMVPAGGYYVVPLIDKLLNKDGTVVFITKDTEVPVPKYSELDDNEAWALINNVWQVTKVSTPGAPNQVTPLKPDLGQEDEEIIEPCPAGKVRNPETNRCRNIVETVSGLLPCGAGETRNPATNRCRKVTTVGSSLTPCQPNQERNPTTNRCRQVAGTSTSQVPCQEGYERNPETNRCRKITAPNAVAGAATFPVSSQAPLHPAILISVTFLALAYGIYEYRYDFGNWAHQLRSKLAKK